MFRNMKVSLLIAFFIGISVHAFGQDEKNLPLDERGKLTYYELVDAHGLSKGTLQTRFANFLNKKNAPAKFVSIEGDSAVVGAGKFVISKTVLVMSHPSGEILFNFHAEARPGKYRFWLTDFNFIPYQRDRYGNFVAATSVGRPLEENTGKLNAAQWKEYQVQTAAFAKNFAAQFKTFVASEAAVEKPTVEKKTVTKSW